MKQNLALSEEITSAKIWSKEYNWEDESLLFLSDFSIIGSLERDGLEWRLKLRTSFWESVQYKILKELYES